MELYIHDNDGCVTMHKKKYTKMLELACIGWLWFLGVISFPCFLKKKFFFSGQLCKGHGRKQMAHSNWAFLGPFIKGTFYEGAGRVQEQKQARVQRGASRCHHISHLKGQQTEVLQDWRGSCVDGPPDGSCGSRPP